MGFIDVKPLLHQQHHEHQQHSHQNQHQHQNTLSASSFTHSVVTSPTNSMTPPSFTSPTFKNEHNEEVHQHQHNMALANGSSSPLITQMDEHFRTSPVIIHNNTTLSSTSSPTSNYKSYNHEGLPSFALEDKASSLMVLSQSGKEKATHTIKQEADGVDLKFMHKYLQASPLRVSQQQQQTAQDVTTSTPSLIATSHLNSSMSPIITCSNTTPTSNTSLSQMTYIQPLAPMLPQHHRQQHQHHHHHHQQQQQQHHLQHHHQEQQQQLLMNTMTGRMGSNIHQSVSPNTVSMGCPRSSPLTGQGPTTSSSVSPNVYQQYSDLITGDVGNLTALKVEHLHQQLQQTPVFHSGLLQDSLHGNQRNSAVAANENFEQGFIMAAHQQHQLHSHHHHQQSHQHSRLYQEHNAHQPHQQHHEMQHLDYHQQHQQQQPNHLSDSRFLQLHEFVTNDDLQEFGRKYQHETIVKSE